MSDQNPADVMTLAGLALANAPWLAARLRRLAEHMGQPLPEPAIESAVVGSSRVLAQVMKSEGRPAVTADHNTDPAAQLGRELAGQHRQAAMDLPASLRVLRLMRRAYDDLVRESWVDKDSRSRAHEDVERFFERMFIGHLLALAQGSSALYTAVPAGADQSERLTALVAQREDELRRTMDAARQAGAALRQARERTTALAAELAQAQAWGKTQRAAQEALKAELAAAKAAGAGEGEAALKARYAAAQAQTQARLKDLESRLTEAQSSLAAQREVEDARELALQEINAARAEADAAREEIARIREQADQAVAKAESQIILARREVEEAQAQAQADANRARYEVETAQDELRKAKEAQASLASEAEAMRTRLTETGSRLTQARRAEELDLQAKLAQYQERIQALEAELGATGQNLHVLTARLAEQESLHAFKDERMREQSRAVAETQELLVKLGATKNEIIARAQVADAERERLAQELAAERKRLGGDLAQQSTTAQTERARLNAELVELRQKLSEAEKTRDANQSRAQTMQAERDRLAGRLVETGNSLEKTTRLGQAAAAARDACASLLSTHLALTEDAVAAVDAGGGVAAWNRRFPELFGLEEKDRESTLETLLPLLAKSLQRPEIWLARVRELLADPQATEEGLTLACTTGQTLVFRSHPTTGPVLGLVPGPAADSTPEAEAAGIGGRLFNFRDVSLEHDMENLVREIEAITRYELGQSLTAFIHLPQELLDDPATTPEQSQKLTVIRDSGYRIVNTVNMAVDIFRMERGLYRMPQGRTLDLAVVARRAVKDVNQLAESRHVDLELLLEHSPLPLGAVLPGPGDPIPAHALVLNLLRDALEAAPRQSSVQATLRVDEGAGLLCLDITRPGGMSPDELARFFDKPLGLDPGDGLARARYAAKLIAGAFGGSLTVHTNADTTTMSLRLPNS